MPKSERNPYAGAHRRFTFKVSKRTKRGRYPVFRIDETKKGKFGAYRIVANPDNAREAEAIKKKLEEKED